MAIAAAEGRSGPASAPLSWRLYRLYLAPVLIAALLAAFSLGGRAAPRTSTLSPEAFEGGQAFALLHKISRLAGASAPGSTGDARLAGYIEGRLRSTGGPMSGGYALRRIHVQAATGIGSRRLTVLIASRPGASARPPIVLIAHRDALGGRGSVQAQLSGTAALLEIAAVLARTETTHPVQLVFSDGGSAGAGGIAAYLASQSGAQPPDAAIVLGDLAGAALRPPLVQPYSDGLGGAPETLTRTLNSALAAQLGGVAVGTPGLGSQLAHLAFPLSSGEAGLIDAAGIPAVSVSLSGEGGPPAGDTVSQSRLEETGRAVLSAFYALDGGGEVPRSPQSGLPLGSQLLPSWALRLLIGSLLLAPLAVVVDALTRAARRGERPARFAAPILLLALPLLACAVTVRLLGLIGLPSAPAVPVNAAALPGFGGALAALAIAACVLALGLRLWWGLAGPRLRRSGVQRSGGAVLVAIAVACALTALVWIVNPYAALLLVAAPHLWLLLACPQRRPGGRLGRLALALAPLLALLLVILYYAASLRLGVGGVLIDGLILFAGGHVGVLGMLVWSLALGTLAAVAIVAAGPSRGRRRPGARERGVLADGRRQAPVAEPALR